MRVKNWTRTQVGRGGEGRRGGETTDSKRALTPLIASMHGSHLTVRARRGHDSRII